MKSYPLYINEYKKGDPPEWLLNTESEPLVGDIVEVDGKEMYVCERKHTTSGLVLVASARGGRVIKA